MKKIKESPGRDRFLEHEEEERLLAACSKPLHSIIMAWIYAGRGSRWEPRHTFGSRLGMAGVDARTIQELGRWSSLAMVQRYVN